MKCSFQKQLIKDLKGPGLSWKEMHEEYTKTFLQQEQSSGSLQLGYSTKLKERGEGEKGRYEDQNARRNLPHRRNSTVPIASRSTCSPRSDLSQGFWGGTISMS